MNQAGPFAFDTSWYEMWTKQSKLFFDSANYHLSDLFSQDAFVNPKDHLKQIEQWLVMLKNQWQFMQLNEQQKAFGKHWQLLFKICTDASDMMVLQWIKRAQEDNPIKNIQELYELWLNCCSEIYEKAIRSKAYQDAYGEYMNAALQFWKSLSGSH